jgi:hypothetical protein
MESGGAEDGHDLQKPRAFDVLRHPVRVRIVEAITEWGMLSPVEIRDRGLCADMETVRKKTPKQQLSHIAYHCRRLAEAGILDLVAEKPVRGATEHFYRTNVEAFFSDEEWAALDLDERLQISRVMWRRFVAQVEIAMEEGSFDRRPDRWLAWGPIALDERGWKEMNATAAGFFAETDHIKREAEKRLKEDGAAEPVPATYGVFVFQAPPRR